jgi:uncharacterized protein with LGFP repeats
VYGPLVTSERAGASGSRYAAFANAALYTTSTTVHAISGAVFSRYKAIGASQGPVGYPVWGPTTSGSATTMVFQRGVIYDSSATGAHSIYGALYTKWSALHSLESGLGLPTSEQTSVGGSAYQMTFQNGLICTSPSTGTHLVKAPLSTKYAALKGPAGVLGLPIADPSTTSLRTLSRFQRGTICSSSAVGTWAVLNPIENLWWATGEAGGFYGLPTADAVGVTGEGQWQRFQHGVIFHSNSGAVNAVTGSYFTKWDQLGGAGAGLGFPLKGPVAVAGGFQQAFAYGALYTSSATGMHVVDGALYPAYRRLGGAAGTLGFPASDPYAWDHRTRADFQHGSLVFDPSTGIVTRLP